jgi:hypothetical protein
MPVPAVHTFADAVEALHVFTGGKDRHSADPEDCRRAVLAAYESVATACDWSFLYRNGRIQLRAPYTTATVQYTAASRALVLSAEGTWPSWARDASVRIGDVVADVESVSGQTATLDATMAPRDDVAAGTSYSLWPRWYALPNDFEAMGPTMEEDAAWLLGSYVPPQEMAKWVRWDDRTGDIHRWSIRDVPDLYGTMGLFVHPASDSDETLDFVYRARPRALRYSGLGNAEAAGTITVTAGSADVIGSSTPFASNMVGSILRIGTTDHWPVTGLMGDDPYAEQRSIIAVDSTTALTLDANVVTSRSDVSYMITDPVEFYRDVWQAFLRVAESELASAKNFDDRKLIYARAQRALSEAKAADGGRVRQRRIAGGSIEVPTRLKWLAGRT